MKPRFRAPQRSRRLLKAILVLASLVLIFKIGGLGGNDRLDTGRAMRSTVERHLATTSPPRRPARVVETPRLVVDRTLSMAGYVASRTDPPTRFSHTLNQLEAAMPDADLYSYGLLSADETETLGDAPTLDQLLRLEPLGLGRSFEIPTAYSGSFNPDDLLFLALATETKERPLVLVTDAVYSVPKGAGVHPVVEALNRLAERGWTLGILTLSSTFHGIPCSMVGKCGRKAPSHFFYSEYRAVREHASAFVPMDCGPLERPFHIIVSSPTRALFDVLSHALKNGGRHGVESLFIPSVRDPPRMLEVEARGLAPYDSETSWPWMMFERHQAREPVQIHLELGLDKDFPAGEIEWFAEVKRLPIDGSSGLLAEADLARFVPASPASSDVRQLDLRPFLTIESPKRDLANLLRPRSEHGDELELIGWARQQLQAPDKNETDLFCLGLAVGLQRVKPAIDRNLDLGAISTLAALDAQRRGRHRESHYYFEIATQHAEAQHVERLERVLDHHDRSLLGQSRASDSAMPAATVATDEEPDRAKPRLVIDLAAAAPGSNTYQIRLVPLRSTLRPELRQFSTGDDSDLWQAHRTYRFAELLEALTQSHLQRLKASPQLPHLYLSIYDG